MELLPLKPDPGMSLYVHLPWCVRKCPYCDFNSHALRDTAIDEAGYVEALLRDLEFALPQIWGRRFTTVFFGGGTPSLFSPDSYDRLISGFRRLIPLSPRAEITMEANPGVLEHGRFDAYRLAGINRVSLGVQSFDPAQLAILGRVHDATEARRAVELALAAGFDSVNLDLMFALPGQTVAAALADLRQALALGVPHLSWYQLTLEPNTAFAHTPPPGLPDHDVSADIHEAGLRLLADAGFERYEVSAFARDGLLCRHNLNYWTFGDYLGIGAGAHSKLTLPAESQIRRLWRVRHPREYLLAAGGEEAIGGEEALSPQVRVQDYLMNALRLNRPFALADAQRQTGIGRGHWQKICAVLAAHEFLDQEGDVVRLREKTMRFLNDALRLAYDESERSQT